LRLTYYGLFSIWAKNVKTFFRKHFLTLST